MSEQVFKGAIEIARFEGFGMITLRGRFSEPDFKSAVETKIATIPDQRRISVGQTGMLAWMSPDELLAVVPLSSAASTAKELSHTLAGAHALVVDVSDARAVFRLKGSGVREVLAKGAPVDLRASAFGPGEIRRTRLGQVACAYWMSGPDQFDLVCFRSVSGFVFDWLCVAAKDGSLPEFL